MTEPIDDPQTRSRMERLKAGQATVLGRVERARKQLEDKRPHSRVLDAGFRTLERDIAAGGGVLAGAVAFRIFLFLVPYTFVAVCVFGVGASASDQDPGSLARDAGIGGLAAKAMSSVGDLSTSQRVLSLAVAGFALLLATRALLKVLRIVHALIWHTRAGKALKPTRAVVFFVLGVTVALGLGILIGKLRGVSFLLGLVGTLLYIAVPVGVWLLVSWYLPRPPDLPWTALIPGAVFFGVGMEILHIVTVYWIAHQVESKTDTYGALGFALVLLLWAYLMGRFVTTAAVINESLWSSYQERRQAWRTRPHRRLVSDRRPGTTRGDAPGDARGLRGEDRRAQGEDQHVARDERHDARGSSPASAPNAAMISENSPRARIVVARLVVALRSRRARRPTRIAATKLTTTVTATAIAIGSATDANVAGIDGEPEGEEEQRGERVAAAEAPACAPGAPRWSRRRRVRP